MKLFVQSTQVLKPKTTNAWYISVALAAIFVSMAVAQLYSFEEYPEVLASLGLPGGHPMAAVWAALLVTGEVAAVPFLLSMHLSPAMRAISMTVGWLVIVAWFAISLIVNLTTNVITNSGILGATIPLAPEWWMVCFFVALAVMAAWASWGLWPTRNSRSMVKKSEE